MASRLGADSSTPARGPNESTAGERLDPAVNLERNERGRKTIAGHPRIADELVERDGIVANRVEQGSFQ